MNRKSILILFLVAGLFLVGCSKKVSKKDADVTKASTDKIRVKVLEIQAEVFKTSIRLTAEVRPNRDVTLSSPAGGKVEAISFEVGEWVRRGTVLAKVDSRLAAARLKSAKAAYSVAKSSYDRLNRLYKQGLSSSKEFESAQSQLDSTDAQLEISQINYQYAVIKAPFNGYISARYVDAGEILGPGGPVFEIVDIHKIKIVVGCSQEDLPKISRGAEVGIYIEALDHVFRGVITSIGVKADPLNKTFPILVKANNPNYTVKAGMIAEVTIPIQVFPSTISIRQDYVLEKDNKKLVAVARKGRAQLQEVVLGERMNKRIRVISGLNPKDKLIIEGHGNVENGQLLEIVPSAQ